MRATKEAAAGRRYLDLLSDLMHSFTEEQGRGQADLFPINQDVRT
jgi:hypothetical protein